MYRIIFDEKIYGKFTKSLVELFMSHGPGSRKLVNIPERFCLKRKEGLWLFSIPDIIELEFYDKDGLSYKKAKETRADFFKKFPSIAKNIMNNKKKRKKIEK
jgi:hypothetical protein